MWKSASLPVLFIAFSLLACNSSTSNDNGSKSGNGTAPSDLNGKKIKTVRSYGEKEYFSYTSASAYSGIDSAGTVLSTGTYTYAHGGDTSLVDMTEVTPTAAGFENIYRMTWTSATAGKFKLTRHVSSTFTFNDSGTVEILP